MRVGKARFIRDSVGDFPDATLTAGELPIYSAVDNCYTGSIIMRDPLRHNAVRTIDALKRLGVRQTLIVTGDAHSTAAHVAGELGVTNLEAGLKPADKVRIVRDQPRRPVVMVGDGVNDAPVLAAADVGIAMGARGATAASESAGVVILADDIGKVATAAPLPSTRSRSPCARSGSASVCRWY